MSAKMLEIDEVLSNMQATFQIPYLRAEEPGDENILRTRTYDLSIT
jgi:hypothetical protein